jgi:hypothetical protein
MIPCHPSTSTDLSMFIGNGNIHVFPKFVSSVILHTGEGAVGKEVVGIEHPVLICQAILTRLLSTDQHLTKENQPIRKLFQNVLQTNWVRV